jgi:hypothetical protein
VLKLARPTRHDNRGSKDSPCTTPATTLRPHSLRTAQVLEQQPATGATYRCVGLAQHCEQLDGVPQ